ncbi:MAG: 16S rRNA (guanine(527)-N(7))-methyltransferase RsmG [Candidatus Dormiibacterota bacterium]
MDSTSRIDDYVRLLGEWPGMVSATERVSARQLADDSFALLPLLEDARSMLDVGSGGGMPGIPLAIARPGLRVTLLEADHRKAAFCTHAAAILGLDIAVMTERAETAAQGPLREQFDAVTARALAPLPVLLELCLPFARVGGRVLAMKASPEADGGAAALLGGGAVEAVPAPSAARARGLVLVVPKVAPTPSRYPRRPGMPAKRPLGR